MLTGSKCDERVLGYYDDPGDGRYCPPQRHVPMTCSFWHFLKTVDYDDPQQKAERTAQYIQWLHVAETADKAGDLIALKQVADEVRSCLGEIPTQIPKDGFGNLDKLDYPDSLTYEEIRSRLLGDAERRGLTEWLEAGEKIRKASLQ